MSAQGHEDWSPALGRDARFHFQKQTARGLPGKDENTRSKVAESRTNGERGMSSALRLFGPLNARSDKW